jgi:DNA-binding response OmpR family regulator
MDVKKLIMVVEDDHYLLTAIDKKLSMSGFTVKPYLNGKQALESLSKSIALPDAICLDYFLGDMTGADFMEKLSKNELWRDIPVLILSNSDEEQSIISTLALGAKIYMLKTQYKLEDVVVQLNKLLLTVE